MPRSIFGGRGQGCRWWCTLTELVLRLLPILMAVKSCRGRAIDWQRGGVRKVVCLVSSASPSTISGTAAAASPPTPVSIHQKEKKRVDCARRMAFHVGTNASGAVGGNVREFNGKGGKTTEKLVEPEQEQGGAGFNAKTTYLGKVFCFVSVTLLLLYSSWSCYLLKSSSTNSSCSYSMSPTRTVNSEGGPLQFLSLWRNAMNFGCISGGNPKEKGNGEGGGEKGEGEEYGNWSVQSGAGVAAGPVDKMTLLVTSFVLVSNTITVILFCSYRNTKLMTKQQKTMEKEGATEDDDELKGEEEMVMIKGKMTLCMKICQDFIIKTKIKILGRFAGVSERCAADVGGGGLTPKLQVLREVDRFSSITLLANRGGVQEKVLCESRYLL